jgi:hypothetical protein
LRNASFPSSSNQAGVLIADHGHAGRGGNDDGFGILIEADKALGLGEGLAAKAGVGVHLAAAGLLGVKIEFDAQPFEQPHHRAARLRVRACRYSR